MRRRNERGSVAVVSTICLVMLFGMAAIAVDLGNAFARKRDLQSQADFSALAGASQLGANSYADNDPAIEEVRDYLNRNMPQDDDGNPIVEARHLWDDSDHVRDGDPNEANGEVYFLSGHRMKVVAPAALVNFGLAGALGFESVSVAAEATVQARTGGGVLPFYAVDGCDYGPQTISDPPPGPATINVAITGGGDTTPIPDLNVESPDVAPATVAVNESRTITITGTGLEDTTNVGFFLNDGSDPVFATDIEVLSDTSVTATVPGFPDEVMLWVRVQLDSGRWSQPTADKMGVLRVGGAVLECEGSPSDGNFGTLLLPRVDSGPSDWLAENIASGLQEPLSLDIHGAAGSPWTCAPGGTQVVVTPSSPTPDGLEDLFDGTNCVDTDTGLPDNVATAGLIGTGGRLGRLDADTSQACTVDGVGTRWDTGIDRPGPGGNYTANDDRLTCFIADEATPISSVIVEDYVGEPLLTQEIYYSPRFFYMPVLGVEPAEGGSERYSIVDFRAGFITDQLVTATRGDTSPAHPLGTSTDHNGISVAGGNISKVKVIFFDVDVLPNPPDDAPDSAYIGIGPRIIKLVN